MDTYRDFEWDVTGNAGLKSVDEWAEKTRKRESEKAGKRESKKVGKARRCWEVLGKASNFEAFLPTFTAITRITQ